jgi:hypothetical protein
MVFFHLIGGPMPFLEAALLCDNAQDYGGKVSILGGFVSIWNCSTFPSDGLPFFVGRVAFDGQVPHSFTISVSDPQSEVIFTASAQVGPSASPKLEGIWVAQGLNIVLPIPINFSEAGMYLVKIEVDGVELHQLPLQAVLSSQPHA